MTEEDKHSDCPPWEESGDEELLTLDPFRGTQIVSPSTFLGMLDRKSS